MKSLRREVKYFSNKEPILQEQPNYQVVIGGMRVSSPMYIGYQVVCTASLATIRKVPPKVKGSATRAINTNLNEFRAPTYVQIW